MNPDDNLANLPEHYIGLLQRLPQRQRERFPAWTSSWPRSEGALWRQEWIDGHRVCRRLRRCRRTCRIVVGVDPAVSGAGDETGIVVCAFARGVAGRCVFERHAGCVGAARGDKR
jgi:phage terminase large subunit-like protein